MEVTKRCGNCKWKFNEDICYKWTSDSGICDKWEKKPREMKLERKDKINYIFGVIEDGE